MSSRGGSYRSAGVDIDAADAAKDRIAARVAATHGVSVLRGVGLFGGFFRAPVSDGIGRPGIQRRQCRHESPAGEPGRKSPRYWHDLVNHCVNDILACGARPLFFLDYYATPDVEPRRSRTDHRRYGRRMSGGGLRADWRRNSPITRNIPTRFVRFGWVHCWPSRRRIRSWMVQVSGTVTSSSGSQAMGCTRMGSRWHGQRWV